MKVTMKDNILEIKKSDDEPILCIDSKIAGILLYTLFADGIDGMEECLDYVMALLKEEEDD